MSPVTNSVKTCVASRYTTPLVWERRLHNQTRSPRCSSLGRGQYSGLVRRPSQSHRNRPSGLTQRSPHCQLTSPRRAGWPPAALILSLSETFAQHWSCDRSSARIFDPFIAPTTARESPVIRSTPESSIRCTHGNKRGIGHRHRQSTHDSCGWLLLCT